MNEIAALTFTHQSSVSVVIQRLVRRGLVAKVPSRDDRRRHKLALTPKGRRLLSRAGTPLGFLGHAGRPLGQILSRFASRLEAGDPREGVPKSASIAGWPAVVSPQVILLAFGVKNAVPAINDLAVNGPKAVLEVGAFPVKVRNFSCNNASWRSRKFKLLVSSSEEGGLPRTDSNASRRNCSGA